MGTKWQVVGPRKYGQTGKCYGVCTGPSDADKLVAIFPYWADDPNGEGEAWAKKHASFLVSAYQLLGAPQ